MSFLGQFSLLLPYLVATLMSTLVAMLLIRGHREVPGRIYFGLLMLSVAVWSYLNFYEDGSRVLEFKRVFANLQYLFIGAVPVFFFRFATQATLGEVPGWMESGLFRAALWVVPGVTAVAVWFDGPQGWVRQSIGMVTVGGFAVLTKNWGPWFWVFTLYSYVLMTIAMVLWARYLGRRGWGNPSSLVPFLAIFLPWIFNMTVVAGWNPWPGHDPTTPAFALMGLVLLLSFEKTQVLSALPVARETVMDAWPTPLVVFGASGDATYFNAHAVKAWGVGKKDLGKARTELFDWLPVLSRAEVVTWARVEDSKAGKVWEVEERPLVSRGKTRGWMAVFHDVSAFEARANERTRALETAYQRLSEEHLHHRRTEQQLFYYSLHDSLTGLANRSLFLSRLGQALDRIKRTPSAYFGVFVLNFSGFKEINDRFGFSLGDQFLTQTAERLRETIRTVDTAARAAADTFLVLLDGVETSENLLEAAERLRAAVEIPVDAHGTSFVPSVRIGMALGTPDHPVPESILDEAEIALTRATLEAGTSVVLFQAPWRQARVDRYLLKEDLAAALVQGNLHLVYQPIVDLASGELRGVEALSRWTHPDRGSIPPNVFIPLAEKEGLIQPLGLWVLREVARTLAGFPDSGPGSEVFVAVNVSPRQLTEPDFASIALGILEREGVDPRRIHWEITETALAENSTSLLPILGTLRSKGMRIKLDDFGTGYSSLHSLHRLPVDTLKIDRSFVAELPQGRPIIRTILALARELGLDVVAEGIENPDQRGWLTDLGCHSGQGFLFSRGWDGPKLNGLLRGGGVVF